MTRRLIVNCDDFGQSAGTVEGVRRGHEDGVVTSASLMVRWPAAAAGARYARSHPDLSVGLHLDLGEWWYDDGEWPARYAVVAPDDDAAVRAELDRQLETFEGLLGQAPTHIDSHQHVHMSEPVRSAVVEAGVRLGVPVRGVGGSIRYLGAFHGQDGKGRPLPDLLTIEAFERLIGSLSDGTTELGCHPAADADLDSTYARERPIELEVLCSGRARHAIESTGVELISFHAASAVTT